MLIFKKVIDLKIYLDSLRKKQQSIGFVPTMGALHQGHLSLIKQSKSETDCTVCSIFVNPTQFGDAEDLEKYPRTTGRDIDLLTGANTDVLFLPSVDEIYPKDLRVEAPFDFGALATTMEGKYRIGHFDGVAQVVNRLLNIVEPNALFMGQKDYQQQAIIANMLQQLKSPIRLVTCPTMRENDGLAMSSRNMRLTEKERQLAVRISQALFQVQEDATVLTLAETKAKALAHLDIPAFNLDYFEIADGKTLQLIEDWGDAETVVACAAVYLGAVRLIDNVIVK